MPSWEDTDTAVLNSQLRMPALGPSIVRHGWKRGSGLTLIDELFANTFKEMGESLASVVNALVNPPGSSRVDSTHWSYRRLVGSMGADRDEREMTKDYRAIRTHLYSMHYTVCNCQRTNLIFKN